MVVVGCWWTLSGGGGGLAVIQTSIRHERTVGCEVRALMYVCVWLKFEVIRSVHTLQPLYCLLQLIVESGVVVVIAAAAAEHQRAATRRAGIVVTCCCGCMTICWRPVRWAILNMVAGWMAWRFLRAMWIKLLFCRLLSRIFAHIWGVGVMVVERVRVAFGCELFLTVIVCVCVDLRSYMCEALVN